MRIEQPNQKQQNFGIIWKYKTPEARKMLTTWMPKFDAIDEKLAATIKNKNRRHFTVTVSRVDFNTIEFEARKQKVRLSAFRGASTVKRKEASLISQLFYPTLETLTDMVNKVTPAKKASKIKTKVSA